MSYRIDDGGPAYPVMWEYADNETGMSLRDWFAGQALSNPRTFPEGADFGTPAQIAFQAYAIADAFIAARKGDAP